MKNHNNLVNFKRAYLQTSPFNGYFQSVFLNILPLEVTRTNSVKPSNILVDYEGRIKLCDFGISGRLVDSQAQTRGAGCAAYLSPERIDPERGTYDVRADIWSLGLTLIELATAQFPYSNCKSDFEVCAKILQTEAPQLGPSFPRSMQDFVAKCCRIITEKFSTDFYKI